jgi:signal peptidase I
MRKALSILTMLAEPLAILGIVLALLWASQTVLLPVRVGGWSMGPTLSAGDVVLVRLGARPVQGDIVLLRSPGHEPVLHRVVELLDGGAVRTKGDANAVADLALATPSEVVGRSVGVIPVGALVARWKGRSACATMTSQPNSTRR